MPDPIVVPAGRPLASIDRTPVELWRLPLRVWAVVACAVALACATSFDGLKPLFDTWRYTDEYSYGFFIPVVAAFFVWQKRDVLAQQRFEGSWIGFAVVLAGLGLSLLGELATLYIVIQYAFLVVIAGLALAFMGWRGLRTIAVPLLMLAFMIPLPQFLYQNLSQKMQLVSSQIGVAGIRLLGISVFLEGNVIDLGNYRLQVEEACNGLRYLFPLMALGFIAAYLFRAAFWKRALLFLSTIPITILMNSFRITAIGVLVDRWGTSMAEGFLHDFEGWVVFMACIGVLVAEMAVLAKVGRHPRRLRDVFNIELPAPAAHDESNRARFVPKPLWAALLVLAIAAAVSATTTRRIEPRLERADFASFPMAVGAWRGTPVADAASYVEPLKLDDYLLADFAAADKGPINFYVAWYASQRKGESAHSPRSCIPGGGWEIADLSERRVDGVTIAGTPLRVNRVLIEKGDDRELVYYWFQQRGRVITNEYLVKWFLFWDALTRDRTDGALVRLTIPLARAGGVEQADRQLTEFAASIAGRLAPYVPG